MTEKKSEKDLEVLGRQMDEKIKKLLGRSLSIREVDTGSCNACEVEVNALSNSIYDIERFGLKIVASPRFADMLMITGPVTRNMEHPLLQTFNATPNPKIVVALGGCAISGGLFADTMPVPMVSVRSSRSTCSSQVARPAPRPSFRE